MKNFYTLDKIEKSGVTEEHALADSFEEALIMAFGGKESDYFECINMGKAGGVIYTVECDEVYKYFGKL
jgi:hypothetical protein